jgi:hypothetical protein
MVAILCSKVKLRLSVHKPLMISSTPAMAQPEFCCSVASYSRQPL